jgi:hypothetical protein
MSVVKCSYDALSVDSVLKADLWSLSSGLYWAAQLLLNDALAQALIWQGAAINCEPTWVQSPEYLLPIVSPAEQFAHNKSINHYLSNGDHDQCLALLQQDLDRTACSILGSMEYIFGEGLGNAPVVRCSASLYCAVQHFRKMDMVQQLNWAKLAVARIEQRGWLLGRFFDLSTSGWKTMVEGGRVMQEETKIWDFSGDCHTLRSKAQNPN